MPHNTLINRLLLVTIYINQVCIPLLCILKYPTTSLNLHQPTSMWIFFSFWYFNGEICYCASKHTHAICWVRGRQFLGTIRFSSGCLARESHSPAVVKRRKFCPRYSLSLSLQCRPYLLLPALLQLFHLHHLTPFTLSSSFPLFLLFGPDHPSKFHLMRGISKSWPSRHHLLERAIWMIC